MKHILLFTAILLLVPASFGQSKLQQVIATAGGNAANGSIAIEWTLGEPVIATFSGANTILTQGFHQTDATITVVKMTDELSVTFKIYPNPTGDRVILFMETEETRDSRYVLYDLFGKVLEQRFIVSDQTFIGLEDYPAGIYLLKIMQPDGVIIPFEIIKQ